MGVMGIGRLFSSAVRISPPTPYMIVQQLQAAQDAAKTLQHLKCDFSVTTVYILCWHFTHHTGDVEMTQKQVKVRFFNSTA